ncbi:tannase/feruloyl esterase family alpha/beta hydrolase [Agrobacterium tumefaciens]|uniref:tannase/feruloyl esterase family alpha/beta hydrolase n=1 Tax=Agrobacterium tumefaciens TaxID=358 RepID=UPI0015747D3F|nr:tannase/feruloyl esterase family alpha/beta hydrolase [Agrobacterium tumefaciens]NTE68194.1 tannase/feruloyl esterase family alpha/beta hydrolase [Agrobacterium tumefaciens]
MTSQPVLRLQKPLLALVSATTFAISLLGSLAPETASAAESSNLSTICTGEGIAALVADIGYGIVVKEVPNGPHLAGGVQYVPRTGSAPAYCQATGSYVTNTKTGKTANFLATFPERWNGKFLQLGCSGGCGYLLMNNPAAPPITITAQGYPGQLIEKGYATFGNDLGHVAESPATPLDWPKEADGTLNFDAIEDYLYRADLVMADMGKAFTEAFYSGLQNSPARISRAYFNGCSQGGREALVAATRFPQKYDGIIAGSPALNQPGVILHGLGLGIRAQQGDIAPLTPGQIKFINDKIYKQCDSLDGVADGLIQNPAACNIQPSRDFPICPSGTVGDDCLTQPQLEAVSARLSAVTDEAGTILQPGFSISDQRYGNVTSIPADMSIDAHVRETIGKSFDAAALVSFRSSGPGNIDAYRVIVDQKVYDSYLAVVRKGTIMAEDFGPFMQGRTKLFWYHNLSDNDLTPYMSINRYKQLAELHGGYQALQHSIRLFTIPGSGHCGVGGSGPSNFDAIGALEDWVENGTAPDAVYARALDPAVDNIVMGNVDWKRPPLRSMPLCAFPQMASYKGSGDFKDAASWECSSRDTRMLNVGEAGRQAGVAH